MQKKQLGYKWEKIAKKHYLKQNYNFLEENYTIQWGELDLIFDNEKQILFIEVKVVNHIDQLQDYITQHKLKALKKTIDTYLRKNPTNKEIRLDFVFIKNKEIIEVYKNVNI